MISWQVQFTHLNKLKLCYVISCRPFHVIHYSGSEFFKISVWQFVKVSFPCFGIASPLKRRNNLKNMFVDFFSWISIFLVVIPFSFDPIFVFLVNQCSFLWGGNGQSGFSPRWVGGGERCGSAWHAVFFFQALRSKISPFQCLVVATCSFVIFNATLRIALKSDVNYIFNSKVPRKFPKHAILEWKTHPSLLGACILFPPDSSPVYVWTCHSGQCVTFWTLDPHSWNDLTVSCIESSIISYYFNDASQGSLPQYLSHIVNIFLLLISFLWLCSPFSPAAHHH